MAISALIGAGVGGAGAALQGGDPLKGALIGGLGGAVTGGAMGAFGGAATAATTAAEEIAAQEALNAALANGASQAEAQAAAEAAKQAAFNATNSAAGSNFASGIKELGTANTANGTLSPYGQALQNSTQTTASNAGGYFDAIAQPGNNPVISSTANNALASANAVSSPASTAAPGTFGQGFMQGLQDNKTPAIAGGLGLAALSAMNADKKKYGVPATEHYTGPLSQFKYDPDTFKATYPTPPNPAYQAQYPDYRSQPYAEGGITNINRGYADGGGIAGLLKGRGDGMSDSIPATIADKQPARLADGEFVLPADVVSHLGNGSTDAGAKHLYKMMDKVRQARTGNKKQGKQIAAGGYLPA
jgi:hypothetical protein